LRPLGAPFHKRANGRWSGVKNRDAILLYDAPEAVRFREIRRAFVHEAGDTVGERPVNNVAVASNPADIGSAPKNIFIAEVEDIFRGYLCPEQIAASGVEDAFGFASGAAGVKDEERGFAVHFLG